MSKPIKGFIGPGPSLKDLEPTSEEQANLLAQQESLRPSPAVMAMVWGPSIHCGHCRAKNNPNNVCCHQCGHPMCPAWHPFHETTPLP